MNNNQKIEVDFSEDIKALQQIEAGALDRVSNYVFTLSLIHI